jgi:predicted nucleic acid-binding protein
MSIFVLDVSVAAKWALGETGERLVAEALDLLDCYGRNEIQFVVPDLFWAELGNVLWKAMRLGRCTRAVAETGMAEMRERKLPTVSSYALIDQALAIGMTFDRAVYDCIYIALALESHTQLITADERLANAVAAHLPVKWLGAL